MPLHIASYTAFITHSHMQEFKTDGCDVGCESNLFVGEIKSISQVIIKYIGVYAY